MKEVVLPSGAKLQIDLAPFADSKSLYQAILEDAKGLKLEATTEIDVNLFKDIFCTAFSSNKIEAALAECMKRCTYNKLRIDKDTFEPEDARQDYVSVCFEVAKENVLPFTKSLYAKFSQVLEKLKNVPA